MMVFFSFSRNCIRHRRRIRQSGRGHLRHHFPVQRGALWTIDLDYGGDLSGGVFGTGVDSACSEGDVD
jgi:hypothetical protein